MPFDWSNGSWEDGNCVFIAGVQQERRVGQFLDLPLLKAHQIEESGELETVLGGATRPLPYLPSQPDPEGFLLSSFSCWISWENMASNWKIFFDGFAFHPFYILKSDKLSRQDNLLIPLQCSFLYDKSFYEKLLFSNNVPLYRQPRSTIFNFTQNFTQHYCYCFRGFSSDPKLFQSYQQTSELTIEARDFPPSLFQHQSSRVTPDQWN